MNTFIVVVAVLLVAVIASVPVFRFRAHLYRRQQESVKNFFNAVDAICDSGFAGERMLAHLDWMVETVDSKRTTWRLCAFLGSLDNIDHSQHAESHARLQEELGHLPIELHQRYKEAVVNYFAAHITGSVFPGYLIMPKFLEAVEDKRNFQRNPANVELLQTRIEEVWAKAASA